jgi:NOL1/NOP2/fmu family ribosome biogenesis protein
MEDRFGIPERLFDDYVLFERKKSWSIIRNGTSLAPAAQLKVSKVGLKAFQTVGAFVKPTTRMIQLFGHAATKARLEIDAEQLQRLVANEDLPMDLDLDKGYVILSFGKDMILGLGFYGHGKVMSQIPRKELRRAMVDTIKRSK